MPDRRRVPVVPGRAANRRDRMRVTACVASSTHLLETKQVVVGEFTCPAGDPAWAETNYIGDEPHVVFPLIPVVIDQVGKESVLTTANHALFYDAGQLYRRRLESELGDRCVFVRVSPLLFERLARHVLDDDRRLRIVHAPTDRSTYLRRHLLVRRLREGSLAGSAAEEETVAVLRGALVEPRRAPGGGDRARVAHSQLAEATKAAMARSFPEPLSSPRLAAMLHTSVFHLSRVFRAETGFSIGGYQRSLRLRAALELLPRHTEGLTALALELGFSSHSHFTAMFRREFGVAPSALRD